jgi:transglutaminase-like putative cysteine protease
LHPLYVFSTILMKLNTILRAILAFSFTIISHFSATAQVSATTIASVPPWVKGVPFDLNARASDEASTGGFYYLLIDQQENVATQEVFGHYAYALLTSQGVQELSNINVAYDPSYQKLLFHTIIIHRGGQKLKQLSVKDIQTIQREQSMDRHMYDGTVTSYINLKDVRVGDVIEYSYTIRGYNPVYNDHFTQKLYFDYTVPLAKLFNRIVLPSNKKISFKYRNGEVKPTVIKNSNADIYEWELKNLGALITDNNQPTWYDQFRHVMITDFNSWKEVNDWAVKHFELTAKEQANLQAKIGNRFRAESPEETALKIVRFVQDDVRYLGFEAGLNSHKPHPPLQVFDQLYGDCKDKSLLLSTLLKLHGIDASPVLVNSYMRDKISDIVPAQHAFDHCITQIILNGQTLYVDPTYSNQGGALKNNFLPRYGKGLVIHKNTTDLVTIEELGECDMTEVMTFDMVNVDGLATLHIRSTYTGGEADKIRNQLATTSRDEIQKQNLTYYGNLYPDIQTEKSMEVADERAINRIIIDEHYNIPSFWKPIPNVKDEVFCELYSLALEGLTNISKSNTRKAPYGLTYPLSYNSYIVVNLPEEWTIEMSSASIDGASYQYKHDVNYSDRELTIHHSYKTLADHEPVESIAKFTEDHAAIREKASFNLTFNRGVANMSGVNVYAVILALIVIAAGSYLMFRLYQYDPKSAFDSQDGEPLGGWLILVALGVIISPIRLLWGFITTDAFFANQTWTGLIKLERWGLLSVIAFELVFTILFILYSVLIVLLFFRRRSSLPRLISIFFVGNFVFLLVDLVLTKTVANNNDPVSYKALAQTFFAAAIWVPYFNMSQRVNETFVERLNDEPPAEILLPEPLTEPETTQDETLS